MEIDGNDSLSTEHKEEIHIFHDSTDLLISSILNNDNNNNNNNNNNKLTPWLVEPNQPNSPH